MGEDSRPCGGTGLGLDISRNFFQRKLFELSPLSLRGNLWDFQSQSTKKLPTHPASEENSYELGKEFNKPWCPLKGSRQPSSKRNKPTNQHKTPQKCPLASSRAMNSSVPYNNLDRSCGEPGQVSLKPKRRSNVHDSTQTHPSSEGQEYFLCKPLQFAQCPSPGELWVVSGGETSLSGAIKYQDGAVLKPSGELSHQEIPGSPPHSSWHVGDPWPFQFSPPQSFFSQGTQSSFTDINKSLIFSLCFSLNFFLFVDISTLENLKTLAAIPLSS